MNTNFIVLKKNFVLQFALNSPILKDWKMDTTGDIFKIIFAALIRGRL